MPVVSQPVVPASAIVPPAMPPQPTLPPNSVAWDAESKEKDAKPGDISVPFTFWLTNVCASEVLVNSVRTSCGCTVARLPAQPWHIPPGGGGPIEVTVNIQGKSGKIVKSVTIDSNAGMKNLLVNVNVPAPQTVAAASPNLAAMQMNRMRNMMISKSNRQATLQGSCATCHVNPAVGRMGKELYATACSICHNAEHRATDVPDLQALNKPADAPYWKQFITEGKQNSMMPAFAIEQGGFLTPKQVTSLVAYLVGDFRKEGKILYHDPHAGPAVNEVVRATNAPPTFMGPKPAAFRTNASPSAAVGKPTAQITPRVSVVPDNAAR
jgi:mono/diheme cytochrome c family protein